MPCIIQWYIYIYLCLALTSLFSIGLIQAELALEDAEKKLSMSAKAERASTVSKAKFDDLQKEVGWRLLSVVLSFELPHMAN